MLLSIHDRCILWRLKASSRDLHRRMRPDAGMTDRQHNSYVTAFTLWRARSKASSKGPASVNTSGCRYDNSAYSSCRLFCIGVPVSSSVCWRLQARKGIFAGKLSSVGTLVYETTGIMQTFRARVASWCSCAQSVQQKEGLLAHATRRMA